MASVGVAVEVPCGQGGWNLAVALIPALYLSCRDCLDLKNGGIQNRKNNHYPQ